MSEEREDLNVKHLLVKFMRHKYFCFSKIRRDIHKYKAMIIPEILPLIKMNLHELMFENKVEYTCLQQD